MSNRSLPSLLSFLDYLATKGLMPRNTVVGRKAACNKVLGILDPEEQTDVTHIDIESAMARFINLEGKGYTPSSLVVYKSRVTSAISDFENYLDNPAGFKPSAGNRKAKSDNGKTATESKAKRKSAVSQNTEPRHDVTQSPATNVFPIPIRADVVVRINGLPFDLTPAEADKIASVVKAMAMKTD
jgi:hypothetical protein